MILNVHHTIRTMFSRGETKPFLKPSSDGSTAESDSGFPPHKFGRLKRLELWIRTSSPCLSRYLLVIVTTSALWACIILFILRAKQFGNDGADGHNKFKIIPDLTTSSKFTGCGRSTTDALARGCKYDILTNHWVPGHCVDPESIEDYQSDGSWFGFADHGRTERLSIEEMSRLPFYYTSARDHIVHCAKLWKKQYRAAVDGRESIDSVIADEHHTMHCAEYLINMTDWGTDFWNMPIKVFPGYSGCWSRRG